MTILYAIARYLGFGGCCVLLLLGYYEGIPGASRISFLTSVPIIGDLAAGRVHTYAADQVKIATAQANAKCDARLEKTVSTFQYEALAAQRDEENRRRLAAEVAATNAAVRAADALRAKETAEDQLEALAAAAKANGKLSTPTEEDRQWLDQH